MEPMGKLSKASYTNAEEISEVSAVLRLEGMHLDDDDILMMQEIQRGALSFDQARERILKEV